MRRDNYDAFPTPVNRLVIHSLVGPYSERRTLMQPSTTNNRA